MFYKEFCDSFNRRHGTMLPVTQNCTSGYCSLYYFSEPDAKKIMSSQSSKGLNKYGVFSNRLVLDYDNGDASIWGDLPKLLRLKAPLRVYTSGGKGYHVEIQTKLMKGSHVPYSHRVFVEKLNVDVDLGLYRHDRILSNSGRIHPKTGNPKKPIVEIFSGTPLTIPETIPIKKHAVPINSSRLMLHQAAARMHSALNFDPNVGKRHITLWGIAKDFHLAGLDFETTLNLMYALNKAWSNPKKDSEVEVAVAQAFDVVAPGGSFL